MKYWTPEQAREAYEAHRAGVPTRELTERYGVSRSSVIGIIHRYRHANDLPGCARPVGAPAVQTPAAPKRSKPAKPTTAAPVRAVRRYVQVDFLKPTYDDAPRCEQALPDGSTCGRRVVSACMCAGHAYLADRNVRLHPPARRVTSGLRLAAEIERTLPRHLLANGRGARSPVVGLSHMQISQALQCDGSLYFDRLASSFGWERVDEHEFRQVTGGNREVGP